MVRVERGIGGIGRRGFGKERGDLALGGIAGCAGELPLGARTRHLDVCVELRIVFLSCQPIGDWDAVGGGWVSGSSRGGWVAVGRGMTLRVGEWDAEEGTKERLGRRKGKPSGLAYLGLRGARGRRAYRVLTR